MSEVDKRHRQRVWRQPPPLLSGVQTIRGKSAVSPADSQSGLRSFERSAAREGQAPAPSPCLPPGKGLGGAGALQTGSTGGQAVPVKRGTALEGKSSSTSVYQ